MLEPEPVVLGRISGVFGVRGWVRVFSYTEPREALLNYRRWLLGNAGEWRSATLAEGQRHGKTVVVRLEGCEDRDRAASLIGKELAVPRDELPAAEEGHYYWSDLEGMQVRRRNGTDLGRLASLLETGAHDVMVVKGDKERLIPFVTDKVVLDVDQEAGVITVDWEWD